MEVTIWFQPAEAEDSLTGTIDFPARLEMDFDWNDCVGKPDEDEVYAPISYGMTAALSADPIRLTALFGEISDRVDWRLAPRLVGEPAWAAAQEIVRANLPAQAVIEIEDLDVAAFEKDWRDVHELALTQRVRRVPGNPEERERFDALLRSDPRYAAAADRLLGLLREESDHPDA